MTQLALDIDKPFYVVPVCDLCGEALGKIETDAPDDWNAAVKWAYIALVAHDRERHPEENAVTRAAAKRLPKPSW